MAFRAGRGSCGPPVGSPRDSGACQALSEVQHQPAEPAVPVVGVIVGGVRPPSAKSERIAILRPLPRAETDASPTTPTRCAGRQDYFRFLDVVANFLRTVHLS